MSSRVEEASSSANGIAGSGEPGVKRQRVMDEEDLDGPMEDEEAAKQKLEEAGFEEGNFTEEEGTSEDYIMTPLIHFCLTGDLKMCRFLLSKGASTTESTESGVWFPLMAAAYGGHIGVLEWLFEHGAKQDVQKVDGSNRTSLNYVARTGALGVIKRRATLKWLILNGALEERPGEISYDLLRRDLRKSYNRDDRRSLLSWAEETVNTHRNFMIFLMGTLGPSAYSLSDLQNIFSTRLKSDDVASIVVQNVSPKDLQVCWEKLHRPLSINSCLNGQLGILQQISEFAGVVRGRELCIKEQLAEKLKLFLEDVPAVDVDLL